MTLHISLEDNVLNLYLKNSKPLAPQPVKGGLGLMNVAKRLAALYPGHNLKIENTDHEYVVRLSMPLRA